MMKDTLIQELTTLSKHEFQNRNVFKARAYNKVIRALAEHTGDIETIEDIEGIPGIGTSIHAKIVEILATGKLAEATEIRESGDSETLDALLNIYGVGPAKAAALVSEGITSMADIRQHPEKLNEKQLIGLRHYDDFLERIPREEMKKHERYIKRVVSEAAAASGGTATKPITTVVGSYRRGAVDSGDIDVLLAFPGKTPKECEDLFAGVIAKLRGKKYITDVLAEGQHKCLAVCKLVKMTTGKYRRLDLLLTPMNEYPYALLYFTGSQKFNIECRVKAREKGYSLSEHGLKRIHDDGDAVVADAPDNLNTEAMVLKFLGIKNVPPIRR